MGMKIFIFFTDFFFPLRSCCGQKKSIFDDTCCHDAVIKKQLEKKQEKIGYWPIRNC